ncbi:MAG TPA: hypothetical protein VG455_15555 [Acidimicrobiales bacterium]|nr:hypothetical protein [Acidimicrobiales bacterium]
MTASTCEECGAADVRVHLGDVPLCDRCADRRVARLTGLPKLGAPPPPFVLTSPDGGRHRMRPRPWRAPTGIVVELEEMGVPVGEGFQFSILGPHDAEVGQLLAQLRTHAEAEVARRYLEPNPHRGGWRLASDEVAGRLVWSEDRELGEPYDVVVDGRIMSWGDLGRALEPFEGWRFRLVIEHRSLDVRPDAEVVALPAGQQPSPAPATDVASAPERTIEDVLTEFLAAQEQRLAPRTFANYRTVVDLLRHCLNGYGHQYLDEDERARFEHTFNAGDEEAFVHLFGPEKIADVLGEFLDYFMVRKVMAGEELLRAAGTVTKKLAKWMAANGYLHAEAAGEVVERGAGAARDLPRAEQLSRLLYEHAQRVAKDYQLYADDDVAEDYFTIERVEPGALWLTGGIGPVNVDPKASSLARPGWSVYFVLSRSARGWQILEAGNVYGASR